MTHPLIITAIVALLWGLGSGLLIGRWSMDPERRKDMRIDFFCSCFFVGFLSWWWVWLHQAVNVIFDWLAETREHSE